MAKAAESAGSDVAEMKTLFKLAHSKPVNVAFALGGDGKAVIKLDKRMKPKALMAALKESDPKIKNPRCGTVEIDPSDGSTANFTMNKAASGFDGKLIAALKGTGVSKVNITVGGDDAEGPPGQPGEDDDATSEAAPAAGATAAGQPSPPTMADASPDVASAAAPDAPAPPPPPPATPAPPAAGAPAGQDAGALTAQLTGLVKQMITAIGGNPGLKTTLAPLATTAQTALKQGNLQQAAAGIASLQQALASGGGAPANGAGAPPPPPDGAAAPPPNGAVAAPPAPPAPGGDAIKPSDTPAGKAHAKAGVAWKATHTKMTGEIDKLTSQFTDAFKDHAQAAELQKAFKSKIDGVLGKLDQSLSSKLGELDGAKDSAAHAKIVADAKKILAQYQQVVSSDPNDCPDRQEPVCPHRPAEDLADDAEYIGQGPRIGSWRTWLRQRVSRGGNLKTERQKAA